MPIENLSNILRMPRLGKIRLGKKVADGNDPYPKALDYFRVDEDGGITSKEAAEAFKRVYGNKPKVLEIMFPTESVEAFFPQYYTAYGKTKGKICQGDGKKARRWMGKGENCKLVEIPCPGQDCEWYKEKRCRRLATLQVILPKVPGLGVWHISTTSKNSIININSGVELIRQLTGGRVSFIPLKLRLRETEVQGPDGYLKKVYVLDLASEDICFYDVLQAMNRPPIQALLPDPKDDPRPDDLYPDQVVEDEDQEESVSEPGKLKEELTYQSMVEVLRQPSIGKKITVVGKDSFGEVVLVSYPGGKVDLTELKPGHTVDVKGQFRNNGKRFVLVEEIEVIPF